MGLTTSCLFVCLPIWLFAQNIENYRKNYIAAVEDKNLCQKMIQYLDREPIEPLTKGYKGVYQTVWANHVMSPIAKWNTFNKGKINLEQAIVQDNQNIELRILRYSVQTNAPKFLGYYKNLVEDANLIKQKKHTIKDASLLNLIKSL